MTKENLENLEGSEHFEESFESTIASIAQVEDRINAKLIALHFDEEEAFKFCLAVREAAVNAVVHGNQEDPSKKVLVDFNFDVLKQEAFVTITDEGPGFVLDEVPDPIHGDGLLKTSGRGILLMKALGKAEFLNNGKTVILRKSQEEIEKK
jgi:serine/threonine-protein kinase RsbW